MKVLHLSTYDTGGAGIAVHRLHRGLLASGTSSQMLVQRQQLQDERAVTAANAGPFSAQLRRLRFSGEFVPNKLYPNRERVSFSSQWLPDRIATQVDRLAPTVINLHWINHGFVQVESIAKLKRPLVWTLHDMWPFTGGCHYSEDCDAYKVSCGRCPLLHSNQQSDLSSWVWHRKLKTFQQANLTVISPSRWLASCARSSSLLQNSRIEVVPHGIDLDVYRPTEKSAAKRALGLPPDKRLILFGALNATQNKRKGFHLLLPALRSYVASNSNKDSVNLAIFGAEKPAEPLVVQGCGTHYLGKITDENKLSLVYSAADVMVIPSVQEAFGQTASEAIACGTPVVAFDATGLKDIVCHQHTGYLAKPFETIDLAKGIAWVLEDEQRHSTLCRNARNAAEKEFSLALQSRRYLSIYNDLLKE